MQFIMHSLSARTLALLVLFLVQVSAQLTWSDGTSDPYTKVVLPSYGDGELHVSVLYKSSDEPEMQSTTDIFTVGAPTKMDATGGYTNYTYSLSFTGAVGVAEYKIAAGSDVLEGKIIAAGFVIKDNGKVVSGDDGEGVTIGQSGDYSYEVEAVGVDGKYVDLSGTKMIPKAGSGSVYYQEIDEDKTGFSDSKFILAVNKYRVGTGAILLSFEATAIEYEGEFFETVLHVKQDTTPTPPCVVEGAELAVKGGVVKASMYNILSPPRSSPVKEIVLKIGGKSISFDSGASDLSPPTSTVVFSGVTSTGSASITCDGEDAVVIMGGAVVKDGLTVTGSTSDPLATDTVIEAGPTSDTDPVLTSVIRAVDASLDTMTGSEATTILDEYCAVISGTACAITKLAKGSVVLTLQGIVTDETKAEQDLRDSFESCSFQKATGYACDKLELGEVSANAVIAETAGATGIATWTIILIACMGALALVALVSLTLWAAHRRASVMSESSYSSSGPLGVPDPSDLLYEQSIVRDVYGRGDAGGPSAHEAERSEHLANMREDFPRPPSSASGIGLSRARSSMDASSTYSV